MKEEIHTLAYLAYDKYADLLNDINNNISLLDIIGGKGQLKIYNFYTLFNDSSEFSTEYKKRYDKEILYLNKLGIMDITDELSKNISKKIQNDITFEYKNLIESSIKLLANCGLVELSGSKIKVTPMFSQVKAYKEYEDDEYMSRFINDFSIVLTKITQQQLDYVNDIINLNGKNLDNVSYKQATINMKTLQEIKYIAITIQKLENIKIDSSTYGTRFKGFQKFTTTALKTHNIIIDSIPPFSSPSNLYIEIDKILTRSKLEKEHKQNFYREFLARHNRPKQKHIEDTIKKHNNELFLKRIDALHHNEQAAFYDEDREYPYSTDALELIEEYSYSAIHQSLYNTYHDDSGRIRYEEERIEQKIYTDKKINNSILSYPFKDNISNILADNTAIYEIKSLCKKLF